MPIPAPAPGDRRVEGFGELVALLFGKEVAVAEVGLDVVAAGAVPCADAVELVEATDEVYVRSQ
jgi:hypothetical protein